MAKVIMIQGTMSNVGKSFLAAGLCRIMKQDGYRVAPFKSQNMALNSFITEDGLEMGRAQVMQAEAAGIKPMVCMNPVLLKPVSHTGSQVIVNGEVAGNYNAHQYFSYRERLVPEIKKAFRKLETYADIIVIEGAGSPAELNLKEKDIVNMGLARMVDAPVLLAGDIDRGGVFAQLLGTLMLLEKEERARVKGLIVNKFRGDLSVFTPGVRMLEERGKIPVLGVVPYMDLALEDEDSLTERFGKRAEGLIDIGVIRYPRISNFTDFNVFEQLPQVSVRYITSVSELHQPDLLFLPGSKNTMGDLKWMRQNGLEAAVKKMAEKIPVWGICGGYQMLGQAVSDPDGVEEGGEIRGMELLPLVTRLEKNKVRCQTEGRLPRLKGIFSPLSDMEYRGYEIHMGHTSPADGEVFSPAVSGRRVSGLTAADGEAFGRVAAGAAREGRQRQLSPVICGENQNVYGTYIHGIFDRGAIGAAVINILAEKKGIRLDSGDMEDYHSFKEKQYDKLAQTLRQHLNMEEIYGMLREASLE